MQQIFIIRHAEVVYPLDAKGNKLMYPPETPISEEGRIQMEQQARSLKERGVHLDVLYTSPFTRAVQSSEILQRILNTPTITPDNRFADPWIPGWFGVPIYVMQELDARGKHLYQYRRTDDQEEYEAVAKRAVEGFHDVRLLHPDQTIGIVSHGDTIRLLTHRLEHPTEEIPNMSILNKYEYLQRGEVWQLKFKDGELVDKLLIPKEGNIKPGETELTREGLTKHHIS